MRLGWLKLIAWWLVGLGAVFLMSSFVQAATIVPIRDESYSMVPVGISDSTFRAKLLDEKHEEVPNTVVTCTQFDKDDNELQELSLITDAHGIATCPLVLGTNRARIRFSPTVFAAEVVPEKSNVNLPAWSTIPLVASIGTIALANAGLAMSQIGLKEFIMLMMNSFFALFAAKKNRKLGIVYDSTTQKPVAGAIVQLYRYDVLKLIGIAKTDKNGAYLFSTQPGSYVMSVIKPGFTFPSHNVEFVDRPIDAYLGQVLEISESYPAINYMIPIDPTDSAKVQVSYFYRIVTSGLVRYTILSLGTLMTAYSLILYPTLLGFLTILAFLILWIADLILLSRHIMFSKVIDNHSKNGVSLALVRVIDSEGKLQETYVSDIKGRVLPRTSHHNQKILIERSGYMPAEYAENRIGLIEKKKFEILKAPN